MTRLSVNINKIATLRNARGGNIPDVLLAARRAQEFGAQGITVHPRPDERHITRQDAQQLRAIVNTEYNIEGNPIESFMELVLAIRPEQVTLVPDAPDALTSNAGWNTLTNAQMLREITLRLREKGIRVSIFVDPVIRMVEGAAAIGADRVELYTEPYAQQFHDDAQQAVAPYIAAAQRARELGMMVNAGHDLNLDNLSFFIKNIPWTAEVSIGHALIADALYLGLENTIQAYRRAIADGSPDA